MKLAAAIVLLGFLSACATSMQSLQKNGNKTALNAQGNYRKISSCTLEILERTNPMSKVGRGLGDKLTYRDYADQKYAIIFGPSTGLPIFLAEFRPTSSGTSVNVHSQAMPPYSNEDVISTLKTTIQKCENK